MLITHRVVHGGPQYSDHQIIDDSVLEYLKTLIPFAPLHQPYNIHLIEACQQVLPDALQVACFDTVFHSNIPEVAKRYALPFECYERGEHVYGYHGLSYEYILQSFTKLNPQYKNDRIVIAHLGSGASMCGIKHGLSKATSMGFSTLEGLPMSTRPGHFDPGMIFYWLDMGMSINEIKHMLYHESGLLGLSGISADFRVLSDNKSAAAQRAIETLIYRVNCTLGDLVAQLGGIDHLIFTAGIGEHAVELRESIIDAAASWLNINIDARANNESLLQISQAQSQVKCWVIPTDEERMMVHHAIRLSSGVALANNINQQAEVEC